MSKALAWIRKSKGSDDDIGLEEQRRQVNALADDIATETVTLDLGIQTGFSTMSRDSHHEQLLDEREDVQSMRERLETGEFDYLVAFDDNRVCRDEYFSVIEHSAKRGDCEVVYVADIATDDLTHDIRRRVNRETKQAEIRKSKQAIKKKKERGDDLGRPRFGMTYNEAKTMQVPGERFEDVIEAIQMNNRGRTYEEISDELDIPISTISRVVNRAEWYIERERYAET